MNAQPICTYCEPSRTWRRSRATTWAPVVHSTTSAAIILVVLTLSIALDLAQEHKAERAIDRLRESVAITVDVLRSGQLAHVPSERIVPF